MLELRGQCFLYRIAGDPGIIHQPPLIYSIKCIALANITNCRDWQRSLWAALGSTIVFVLGWAPASSPHQIPADLAVGGHTRVSVYGNDHLARLEAPPRG